VTLGGLIETCARVAGTTVQVVRVPPDTAPPFFPLIRPFWATQQRSAAKARAAGMPSTPLAVTVADVLAWDRERGEPPLERGFSPVQDQAVLAEYSQSGGGV
jgi:2'-hydroxyisoflavone reductase